MFLNLDGDPVIRELIFFPSGELDSNMCRYNI